MFLIGYMFFFIGSEDTEQMMEARRMFSYRVMLKIPVVVLGGG